MDMDKKTFLLDGILQIPICNEDILPKVVSILKDVNKQLADGYMTMETTLPTKNSSFPILFCNNTEGWACRVTKIAVLPFCYECYGYMSLTDDFGIIVFFLFLLGRTRQLHARHVPQQNFVVRHVSPNTCNAMEPSGRPSSTFLFRPTSPSHCVTQKVCFFLFF